uniref:PRKG1_interact domain-containing protein n=1 Tax=Macrostomum lignano TaxID=282301 RepID=A0A1I8IUZ4_9PLAT
TDLKEFHNKAAAAAAAAAAATAAPDRANPSPSREAANLNGFRVGGPAEFGSSSSAADSSSRSRAVSRDRADSLELSAGGGARSGSPQTRSLQAETCTLSASLLRQQRRQSRPQRSSAAEVRAALGAAPRSCCRDRAARPPSKESGYLTVHSGSRMMLALSQKMQDPAERARMQQRYLELRELLAELREQKSAKEAQLQALLARER